MTIINPTPLTGIAAAAAGRAAAAPAETASAVGNIASSVLPDGFAALTRPEFWLRIGVGAFGLLIIWWGVWIIVITSKPVQNAVGGALGVATDLAPGGGTVKKAAKAVTEEATNGD